MMIQLGLVMENWEHVSGKIIKIESSKKKLQNPNNKIEKQLLPVCNCCTDFEISKMKFALCLTKTTNLWSMKLSRPMKVEERFAARNIPSRPADTLQSQIELSGLQHLYLAKGMVQNEHDISLGN